MSLFGTMERRNLNNPAVPLTDPGLLEVFGGTGSKAGVPVNETSALSIGAVFRSVSLISGTCASLPLKGYRYSDKAEVRPRALSPYNDGPFTQFELWETALAHCLLWGNSFLLKVRNAGGSIDHLLPLHPSLVTVRLNHGGEDVTVPQAKVFETRNPDGTITPLTTYDVLHVPGLSYNGLTGVSVLQAARQTLGLALATEESASRLFSNGTMLSGVLTTDRVLTQGQADAVKKSWKERRSGLSHAHDIAVLDAGTKWIPMSLPPADAQMLEARVFQIEEVARWFGLPPSMIGEVSKNASQGGGNGIEAQGINMLRYSLNPWLVRFESRVTREVVEPRTQYAEFVREGLLRGEIAVRFAAYATAIGARFMTSNEARKFENMPPLPGGDELIPFGTTPGAIVKPPTYPAVDNKG